MTTSLDQGTRRRFLERAPVDGTTDKNVVLADLLEEVTRRLQSGEPVDWEAFAGAHPEFADELRALLPAVEFLVDWSQGTGSDGRANAALKCESSAAVGVGPPLGRLGDFRIVREIGRGGMGVVYEAEQTSLNRRVALKVLPFAAMLDERQLKRFRNEARAAATLDHPHIVPVHAIGCERGVHFYAMSLVNGQTLAQVIGDLQADLTPVDAKPDDGAGKMLSSDEHLSPDEGTISLGPTSRSLAKADTETRRNVQAAIATDHSLRPPEFFRTVARLGSEAASALDHAHSAGVIHRDIKPANLMIDAGGKLWITDFGLARLGTDAGMTITGDLLGTVRYMSPEQALAKRIVVDHRTDVYSLGVTLYELLTMQPAFAGADREEVLRQIAFEEPIRPRRLNKAIPAELEVIVLKAMEKKPDARYGSALEMAEDLERFLRDEPIKAKPPGLARKLSRWSRRHKPVVVGAICIAVCIAVAGACVLIYQRAMAQRQLRIQQQINVALTEAARLRSQATHGGRDDLGGLAAAREQMQRATALAESGAADPEQIARVQQLSAELNQELKDQQLLASLDRAWMMEMGTDPQSSGTTEKAVMPILRQALETYGIFAGGGSPDELAVLIASKPKIVREQLLAALEEWRAIGPSSIGISYGDPSMPNLVREVFPGSPAAIDGHIKPGDRLIGIGQGEEGPITDIRRMTADEIRKTLNARDPGGYVRLQVIHRSEIPARTYCLKRDTTREWLDEILKAADNDPWRARVRQAYDISELTERRAALAELADEVDVERQPVRVLTRFAWSLGVADRSAALLKHICRRHPTDVLAHYYLGWILGSVMKPPQHHEAVRYYAVAIALRPDTAILYLGLGNALRDIGQTEEAMAEFRECHRLEPSWPAPLVNLSAILEHEGKIEEAVAEYREAIRVQPHNYMLHHNLGVLFHRMGRFDEAVAEYREAQRVLPDAVESLVNLSDVLRYQGKVDEALSEYGEAIKRQPGVAALHACFGDFLDGIGKTEQAFAEYREAIRLAPNSASGYSALASSLGKHDRLNEAIETVREAIRLAPRSGRYRSQIGKVLTKQGKLEEAVVEIREAIRLEPDAAEPHIDLSEALQMQGQPDEAVLELREASRLAPDDFLPRFNLGLALSKQGKFEEAVAEYREASRLGPDRVESHFNIAILMAQNLGKPGEAIAELQEIIRIDPDYPSAHGFLAWIHATRADKEFRKPSEALIAATKAVELAPTDSNCWCTLGVARYANTLWKDAISALEKSLELSDPQPADEWLFLFMSHWQLGQKEEAQKWYDKAAAWMKINKPDDELLRFRAEADELLGINTEETAGSPPASSPQETRASQASNAEPPQDNRE